MSQVNGNGKEGGLPDANSDVQDAADSPVFRCLQRIPFPLDKSMNSIRNLRCDFLLSLLPIDPTTGNILMPSHERPIYSVSFLSSFLPKIPGFFL